MDTYNLAYAGFDWFKLQSPIFENADSFLKNKKKGKMIVLDKKMVTIKMVNMFHYASFYFISFLLLILFSIFKNKLNK